MAISEFEQARYTKLLTDFCKMHGPPPHLHNKVKLGFYVDAKKQCVELFELRSTFMEPERKVKEPIAKATYVKSYKSWKIYWMPSDMKWHRYEPQPSVTSLEDFLQLLIEDKHCCFWG